MFSSQFFKHIVWRHLGGVCPPLGGLTPEKHCLASLGGFKPLKPPLNPPLGLDDSLLMTEENTVHDVSTRTVGRIYLMCGYICMNEVR